MAAAATPFTNSAFLPLYALLTLMSMRNPASTLCLDVVEMKTDRGQGADQL